MKPRHRAFLAAALALGSCGSPIGDPVLRDHASPVAYVYITVTMGEPGSLQRPLAFSDQGVDLTFTVEARDASNRAITDFNGYIGLSVSPGLLLSVTSPGSIGNYVKLTSGRAMGVRVRMARGYGEVRLWGEDDGYVPVDPQGPRLPACADGQDNDSDGFVDFPADHGCEAANDDTERGGSFAVGTSEPLYFSFPIVSDMQGHTAQSPFVGERVSIPGRADPTPPPTGDRRHRMVVTRINNSGFFVTDIDDVSCNGMPCYNSIFAFNFRTPDGMRPCDLLDLVQGSVSEFVGYTELNQPSFHVGVLWRPNDSSVGACQIPDPTPLTPTLLRDATSLERYEAGLVRARRARMPTVVGPMVAPGGIAAMGASNCDMNGDGRITYDRGAEQQCADACAADPACSEWSAWTRYGQVNVTVPAEAMGGAVGRVLVAAKGVLPTFDPQHPSGAMADITGTLRQVGPNWIIEPRCEADIVIDGDGQTTRPARDTCLHERSEGEE